MLKFAFKTILFILPLLILLIITEYQAKSLTSDFAVKRERLENNIDQAEVVVAGSSHAYYGIKPVLLGVPAVSIAYPGQDFYYDSQILQKYLPQAAHLKLVIITASYFSFEYLMEDSEGKEQTNFYYKFWGIPRQSEMPRLADYSRIALFGLQRSRDFLLTGNVSGTEEIDQSGGNDNLRSTDYYKIRNGQLAVKRHESLMKTKYISQNDKYLDNLLMELQARNIQAVIVTTPCFSSYYDYLNPEKYQRMQNEIESVSQKYNVRYFNYLKDERFTEEDYADGDHLNTSGMEKFSRILKDEIITKYFDFPKIKSN